MPTSWSIEAAHSSSRSPGSGSNSPPSTSESNICSESRATCSTWAMSDSYWIARLRTAASRTSSNSGSRLGEQRPGEEHAVAQPGLGRLDPVEAAELERPSRAPAPRRRMMSPRPGLIPGPCRARRSAAPRASATSSPSASARDHEALDAEVDASAGGLLGGGRRGCAPRRRVPTSRSPDRPASPASASDSRTCARTRCRSFLRAGPGRRAGTARSSAPRRAGTRPARRRGGRRPGSAACCRRRYRARPRRSASSC